MEGTLYERFRQNLENQRMYQEFASRCEDWLGDISPFTIDERLKYYPKVMDAIAANPDGLTLKEGITPCELGDLVKWTHDNLDSVFEPNLDVFTLLFKVYDVVYNSFKIISSGSFQLAGEYGILKIFLDYTDATQLDELNPDDIDIGDFEVQLMNWPMNFLVAHDSQDEYDSHIKWMERAIRMANPEISRKDLVKRELGMLYTARLIWFSQPYDLSNFATSGNPREFWMDEQHAILYLGSDRVMRDLYPK
jgi:hypothetical protein